MRRPRPTAEEGPAGRMRRAFFEIVAQIPYGRVATYGQVAALAGFPGRARQVGFALAGMDEALDLPWHRVVNAQGKVSPRVHSQSHLFQYQLLEAEGVVFKDNRLDLKTYLWRPDDEEA